MEGRRRVTTTSYPCVENEREGSEGGLGGEKAVLLRIPYAPVDLIIPPNIFPAS